MPKFKVISEGEGFYTIKDVPVFEMHTDRGFPCDEAWMKAAIANHTQYKTQGYRPTMIIGHNVKGQEKESVGFLDTLVLKGKRLYADLVRVPKEIKEKIVRNSYPSRSVEVLPQSKRILTLALLGGTTPHFALPQMSYGIDNNETSLWLRSSEMELTEEMKKEIYGLVGTAVAEAMANANASPAATDDEDADIIYEHPETGEQYAIPAALAKVIATATHAGKAGAAGSKLSAKMGLGKGVGRKVGRQVGKAGGFVKRHPVGAAGSAAAGVVAQRAVPQHLSGRKPYEQDLGIAPEGYSIDDTTGEVYLDGQPLGMIVTYDELETEGMTVPQAVKDPSALPASPHPIDPQLAISSAAVGEMSGDNISAKTAAGAPAAGELVQPLDREESDQFALEQRAEIYDLQQRVERAETANALISEGRRAEEYTKWLNEQHHVGVPIGDVDKMVAFMMSLSDEQVEEHKALLLAQPKVALGKMDTVINFENAAGADEIKADYEQNKETYRSLGVSADDLKWAQYARINRGVGEVQAG